MVDYEKYGLPRNTCTPVSKNHQIQKENSWKMAVPPDESLSKDETVLMSVHCSSGTCLHEHISPLLGEHPCIVNICLGPVTVHYREVSLYLYLAQSWWDGKPR